MSVSAFGNRALAVWKDLGIAAVITAVSAGLFCIGAEENAVVDEASNVDAVVPPPSGGEGFFDRLSAAAWERTQQTVRYDPAYVSIPYPGGDVPADTGVCTDVVVRSYRKLGIDLQQLVHEDMKANFSAYPKMWGLSRPDTNIDHRRVPNLETFFKRRGASLPVSKDEADYRPGDLVTWDLNGRNLWHIGIVVEPPKGRQTEQAWFVHNIGGGPELDYGVLQWKVVGHYRYGGPE